MSATWVLLFLCRDGSLPFMTRLPKKRGITQVEEDKSLILRQFDIVSWSFKRRARELICCTSFIKEG